MFVESMHNTIFIFIFFFFSSRRRHTRFSRDWSSDVCSSDLGPHPVRDEEEVVDRRRRELDAGQIDRCGGKRNHTRSSQIGRASCRERVEMSVGAVSLKKKRE